MNRSEIINYLISVNGYKSFLEIGVQEKINFGSIQIDKKVCVDPDASRGADFIMTSDEFFKRNRDKFDIIFVDGLHHADFCYRDVINSLKILNIGGCVVVHDVIPYTYESQLIPFDKSYSSGSDAWNGDVWKAWIRLREERKDLLMHCVDDDWGCGIISFSNSPCNMNIDVFNGGYYVYDKDLILENSNVISVDQFKEIYSERIMKDVDSQKKRCFITHTDKNYIPVAINLVKSLSIFSEIRIIVYCVNCTSEETQPLLEFKNAIVRDIRIEDLIESHNINFGDNGNFYVERANKRTYQILCAKVKAMQSSLSEGWTEICYLDSDCLATPIINEIFNWGDSITDYPLGTEGIHNYMLIIKDGKQIGNPFENSWPEPDNKLCLEWPLMEMLGVGPGDRGTYRTTGIMLMNSNCINFVNQWNDVCDLIGRNYNDPSNIAPFHEETVFNVLLWKKGNSGLPLCYVNIAEGVKTVKDFYSDSVSAGTRSWDEEEHDKRFFAIPNDKSHVKVLHGEKRKDEADLIIDFLSSKNEK
jgi:hypothetical protein